MATFCPEGPHAPAPRFRLNLPVHWRKNYARRDAEGTLKNISVTGAFLSHHESLAVGDKISLLLKVSSYERRITAKVVWSNQFGCGIQFRPTSHRDEHLLYDLVDVVQSKRDGSQDILANIMDKVE